MINLSQEVVDLVVNLHNDCVKFARSNLFKVTRSEGWKRLKHVTQREIKEGNNKTCLSGTLISYLILTNFART